ncbi:MAG: hypothetical protein ACE5JA_03230 [bacterium]
MDEIEINLTLKLSVPEENLTVNGVLMALKEETPKYKFAILDALFQAIKQRTVKRLKESRPERHPSNVHQSRPSEDCSTGDRAHFNVR